MFDLFEEVICEFSQNVSLRKLLEARAEFVRVKQAFLVQLTAKNGFPSFSLLLNFWDCCLAEEFGSTKHVRLVNFRKRVECCLFLLKGNGFCTENFFNNCVLVFFSKGNAFKLFTVFCDYSILLKPCEQKLSLCLIHSKANDTGNNHLNGTLFCKIPTLKNFHRRVEHPTVGLFVTFVGQVLVNDCWNNGRQDVTKDIFLILAFQVTGDDLHYAGPSNSA